MERQLIIAISREFGSGGRQIAGILAERFGIAMYDSNLLEHIANEKEISGENLKKYDEKPRLKLITRTVRGHSNSMTENVAEMQFDFIRKKAMDGESFVILGRCAEEVLKGHPALISVFVLADSDVKIQRIKEYNLISEEEAAQMIERNNKGRKMYHNYYCKNKWGDSRNYDISINSSRLGIDGTVDLLEAYIKQRIK